MRRIIVESMEAMAELWVEGKENIFSTAEIAEKLGIEKWRVRRSLKSASMGDITIIWEYKKDMWCVDPRYVKLERYCKEQEKYKEGEKK